MGYNTNITQSTGDKMRYIPQIGDLVKSQQTGKIGIVVRRFPQYVNYWLVTFHDSTYSVHSSNLKPLESK